jgi:hypothetical protein
MVNVQTVKQIYTKMYCANKPVNIPEIMAMCPEYGRVAVTSVLEILEFTGAIKSSGVSYRRWQIKKITDELADPMLPLEDTEPCLAEESSSESDRSP